METLILHTFSREDVEALNFDSFENLYGHWPQLWSRELKAKYDSLLFAVSGYDEDARELYCIPEVRKFYRQLHQQWPWWAFFLSHAEANLAIPYLCLLDSIEATRRDGSAVCSASVDVQEIKTILEGDFSRLAYLWDIAGLPPADCEARMRSIIGMFTGGAHG